MVLGVGPGVRLLSHAGHGLQASSAHWPGRLPNKQSQYPSGRTFQYNLQSAARGRPLYNIAAAAAALELDTTSYLPTVNPGAGDVGDQVFRSRTTGSDGSALEARDMPAGPLGRNGHSSLPEDLHLLADPAASVRLPSPDLANPIALDNRELDKLVAAIGRNKSTWRRALLLYEWLKESGHILDDRLCTTLIRVCAEHGQAASALSVYEWMKTPVQAGGAGLNATVYTYTAAMKAALSGNLLDKAMHIWRDAQNAGCQPDCRLCIQFIEVCSRMGLVDRAMEMYNEMKCAHPSSKLAPTVHAYTAAMRAATEGGLWKQAFEIWNDMKDAGCSPTGHAYAAVIKACEAGCDWHRATDLFEEMCNAHIAPDVVSCTSLISAMGSGGQWQRAEAVVTWMLKFGIKPNVRTYSALLASLGSSKQWERAIEMLQLMQTPAWGSVQPNAYIYSALIKSMGEHGQCGLAEMVFAQLENQILGPLAPSSRDLSSDPLLRPYSPVLNPLSLGSVEGALGAWPPHASVQNAGMPAAALPAVAGDVPMSPPGSSSEADSSHSWTSASELNGLDLNLRHHCSSSEEEFSLFSVQPTLTRPGAVTPSANGAAVPTAPAVAGAPAAAAAFPPTPRSGRLGEMMMQRPAYSSPAASAAPSRLLGPFSLARLPMQFNGEQRSVVNEVVCGALMHAYERVGRWQDAVHVLARARMLGIEPNTIMYNNAISAAGMRGGQLQLAEQLFSEIPCPDAVTYETMISVYGQAGEAQKAEHAYQTMLSKGMRPRDYAYCGLIAAHSVRGNWEAALRVRTRMRQDGAPGTSVHVYNALLACCEKWGQYERALELYSAMRRERVEPNSMTAHYLSVIGKKGARAVEGQQMAAAAISAIAAAAGTLLCQTGVF